MNFTPGLVKRPAAHGLALGIKSYLSASGVRSRSPGPPFSASMNTTPARWNARGARAGAGYFSAGGVRSRTPGHQGGGDAQRFETGRASRRPSARNTQQEDGLNRQNLGGGATNPSAAIHELVLILAKDQGLPADTRMVVARKAFPFGCDRCTVVYRTLLPA